MLQHEGFRFQDTLWLARWDSAHLALWDAKPGKALLYTKDSLKLRLEHFFEPVFVEEAGRFTLKNNIYPLPINSDVEVTERQGNRLSDADAERAKRFDGL